MTSILTNQMQLVDPFEIEKYDFTTKELVHPLTILARYSGQTKKAYTVAEHTVHLVGKVPKHLKRALPEFCEFEENVQRHIFKLYNEPWGNMEAIGEYDYRICQDEMAQLFAEPYDLGVEPLGITVQCWPQEVAYLHLTNTFKELDMIR